MDSTNKKALKEELLNVETLEAQKSGLKTTIGASGIGILVGVVLSAWAWIALFANEYNGTMLAITILPTAVTLFCILANRAAAAKLARINTDIKAGKVRIINLEG